MIRVCKLEDIRDPGAKGFSLSHENRQLDVMVVRSDGSLHAYLNSCPHTGVNLDWMPNEFLDGTGKHIQCSTHGAIFRIHDGFCIQGPCAGDSLTPVRTAVVEGGVFLLLD